MYYKQWLAQLQGRYVCVYVKRLSDIPREDGGRWCVTGRLLLGEDFILVQDEEGEPPAAIKTKDIMVIEQIPDPACGCDGCQEERGEQKTEVDYDAMLKEWERQQNRSQG